MASRPIRLRSGGQLVSAQVISTLASVDRDSSLMACVIVVGLAVVNLGPLFSLFPYWSKCHENPQLENQ